MNRHHRTNAHRDRAAIATGTAVTVAAAIVLTTAAAVPHQATAQPGAPAAGAKLGDCGSGQLCLWDRPQFEGKRVTHELADTDIESCIALPDGFTAESYANQTGRPVTAYQSAECDSTGEFHTHPGGSWTPESEYQVRAFKIWEH